MPLANTPTQAESLLHNVKQATCVIGLHVKADRMEYTCFNQKGDIFILNGGSLKSVNKFMYLINSISSIENDINMHQTKVWTATDKLSIIWKSDLSDKIKRNFF